MNDYSGLGVKAVVYQDTTCEYDRTAASAPTTAKWTGHVIVQYSLQNQSGRSCLLP